MSRRKPSEGCLTIFRYIYTRGGKNTLRTAFTRSKYIFQFLPKFFRKGVDKCFRVCYNKCVPWKAVINNLCGLRHKHHIESQSPWCGKDYAWSDWPALKRIWEARSSRKRRKNQLLCPCAETEDSADSKSVVERRAGSNPVRGSYPVTSTFTWWIT